MIKVTVNTTQVDKELNRLSRQPDRSMSELLDQVLKTGYVASQVAVHVQTGSLKTSASFGSDVSKVTKVWTGNITYGGPSKSVNNPVDYAIYEQRRGGVHDFMAPVMLLGPLYVSAIMKGMSK